MPDNERLANSLSNMKDVIEDANSNEEEKIEEEGIPAEIGIGTTIAGATIGESASQSSLVQDETEFSNLDNDITSEQSAFENEKQKYAASIQAEFDISGSSDAVFLLPGTGTQLQSDQPDQATPLLRYYSPRLFGAPPQLTNQCDMRILSSDGKHPGPVGDFYLTRILQDANIANFVVGRARFIGGMSSSFNIIHECYHYGKALSRYNIYGSSGKAVSSKSAGAVILQNTDEETYKKAYGERDTDSMSTSVRSAISDVLGNSAADVDEDASIFNIGSLLNVNLLDQIDGALGAAGIISALKTSLSVQQPYYTFEDDWYSYINNVKMMINTAVIMLGLQKSCVRIGDYYYPIGMDVNVKKENDVWANYRFMTPTSGLGSATAQQTDNGDTTQYISIMVDPSGISESFENAVQQSQIFDAVINSGTATGAEIAFITHSTAGSVNDSVINLAKSSKQIAEETLQNLSSGGNGRFTAALASSMARSFTGEHTIYPEVFSSHSSTSSMSLTCHLTSDAGDPYSYLINILVPTFFILGMGLPNLSQNNASAYCYPPIIQCNIPGMWGTRLGMVTSIGISKNPNGKDVSVNGYPLQVDVTLTIKDLQHVLVTSPMNKVSTFLNNHTMFDYIAQVSGVDKYRINGSMRTVARLALAASAVNNTFNNISSALMTDWHSLTNKILAYDRQ